MKKVRRPDIDPDAIAEVMVKELGIPQGTADTVKTAIKLILPTLLVHHGVEELYEIARAHAEENQLEPDGYRKDLFDALVKWAKHELDKYRAAKKP
jgi:hypothetical protein